MISTKRWLGGTNEEYETQHYGFGVQRLQIAVRQMVEQKITSCVKDMNTYLEDSLNLNETDKATLSRSCDTLVHLYCEKAGPSLEIIDREIEKIITVPSNVLLPEDEVQLENNISDEEYEKLKEEVAALRKRIERGALMESYLALEEKQIMSVEEVCEAAKKDMDVIDLLHKDLDNNDLASVLTETRKLNAILPFLKDKPDIFDN